MNLSTTSGPTNLKRFSSSSAGRQIELHQTIKLLSSNKQGGVINVQGESGSGRTHFVQLMGHYVHMRNIFEDGVYYFDLKDTISPSRVDNLLEKTGINTKSFQMKNLLLIFDNVDKLGQQSTLGFQLLLKYYTMDNGFTILITSSMNIEHPGEPIQFTKIHLPELSSVEAAIMLALMTRPINKQEIAPDHDTDESVITLLQKQEMITKCKGNCKKI